MDNRVNVVSRSWYRDGEQTLFMNSALMESNGKLENSLWLVEMPENPRDGSRRN